MLTLFTFVQLFAALVVPVLADRSRDRRPWLALVLVMNVAGLAAIAAVPLATPWGFTALIGFGIGGLFPLVLTLPLDYSPNPDAANRLTAMMLGIGYLISALGPLAVAALGLTMLAGALLLRPQSRAEPMSTGTPGSP